MTIPEKLVKSPMNYTGGKYKLLKQILPLFPDKVRMFVDLFTGGGNVAVNVTADRIVANDADNGVIGIYNKFKSLSIDDVIGRVDSRIEEYGLTMTDADAYLRFRSDYNSSTEKDPLDLFVLICYSFNHQIRFNRDGGFNMPFGNNRSKFNDTIRKNLTEFHERITSLEVMFTCKDFGELKLDKLGNDDFVYCDPPYLITCATYNENGGWNEACERKLLSLLDCLDEKGIKFALSNALQSKGKTNEILSVWSERHNVHHLNNSYSNSSYHRKDRGGADEVLVTNY